MTRSTLPLVLTLFGMLTSPATSQEVRDFPVFSQAEAQHIAVAVQQYAGSTMLTELLSRIGDGTDRRRAITAVANAMEAVGDDGSALVWAVVSVEGPPELSKHTAVHISAAVSMSIQVLVQVIADDIRGVRDTDLYAVWDRDTMLDVLCTAVSAMRKIGGVGANLVTVR